MVIKVNLKLRILSILMKADKALYVREICSLVNGRDDCRNVNGKGRCYYCYRRGDYETKGLVKPDCKYPYQTVLNAIRELEKQGKIKTALMVLRDGLSTWGSDRFRLCYITKEQLRSRYKTRSLDEWL